MVDWQSEYRAEFKDEESRTEEINRLQREIRQADKRTYNGRMIKVFNTAKILALQEQ